MIVEWSFAARTDLRDIFDYILTDNPRAAGDVLGQIEQAVSRLGERPGMGRPGRVEDTRELVIANLPYVVPYAVSRNRVFILRVLHAARQWPDRF